MNIKNTPWWLWPFLIAALPFALLAITFAFIACGIALGSRIEICMGNER